jgi:hypothetical protein
LTLTLPESAKNRVNPGLPRSPEMGRFALLVTNVLRWKDAGTMTEPAMAPQSTDKALIPRYRPQASRNVGTIMPVRVGGDRKIKPWCLKR